MKALPLGYFAEMVIMWVLVAIAKLCSISEKDWFFFTEVQVSLLLLYGAKLV